jgi:hypothetical protein
VFFVFSMGIKQGIITILWKCILRIIRAIML